MEIEKWLLRICGKVEVKINTFCGSLVKKNTYFSQLSFEQGYHDYYSKCKFKI